MTPSEIAAIRLRRASVVGFQCVLRDGGPFGYRWSLAELNADGVTWRTWDMNSPLSREACAFISSAPADIDALLAEVEQLKAANLTLVKALQASHFAASAPESEAQR